MGKHETEERYEAESSGRPEPLIPGAVTKAAAALVAAFSAAFHNGAGTVLTASLLRTIGNSYGSMCFTYGPAPHPATIEALRRAMDAYVAVVPLAEAFLFPESPLGEHVAKASPAVGPFRLLMEKIRAAYWTKRQTMHDGAALDAIADDGKGYDAARFPLKHVVNALVRISPKAQQLNTRYFAGQFK